LFVTGAFGFSGAAVFAVARDEDDAFDTGAAAFFAVFAAVAAVFATAWVGAFALLVAGLAAVVVFTAGFAIDLPEAGLVAADLAFFAVTVVFAGFFIAFAMGSYQPGCSRASSDLLAL
jgi:asparagine N-glycosylation enzyme membrane subunit Stt3